ncbi:TetR/AcrR family transcriptional regulator [Clostridium sediminicola]|uniref:TetR/AcrR family transcriptional regulator n=1 Tax=Clostridium sediminicola TaxID=3114879 RepID=UPI003D17A35C
MKKKTTRQIKAENTKANILAVATDLFTHKTLDEISILEICKKAEVSVGAFYHHFANKAGIIVELYKEIDVQFENEVYPSLIKEEPIEAILKYLERQCTVPAETGMDLVKNIYKAQIDYGSAFFLSVGRGLPHGLYLLIKKAKEQGKIKENASEEQLTNELLIISRGIIYNWCVSDGKTNPSNMVRWMANNYLQTFVK